MPFPAKKPVSGNTKSAKPIAKKKPKPKVTFKAPSDMKSCFIELMFKTGADSLAHPQVKCTRIQGQWTNENAKRYDMLTYDVQTVIALVGRLNGRFFVVNPDKRLPKNTVFKLILRVSKRAADNTLVASVKESALLIQKEGAKPKWKWLEDGADPVRRKIRSANRFIAGAFTNIQLPPKPVRGSKKAEDSE